MEYLTIIGVAILVSIVIGFYLFYCRLNDSNSRVKQLEREIRLLDETQEIQGAQIQKKISQRGGSNNYQVSQDGSQNRSQIPQQNALNTPGQNNQNNQNNQNSQSSHGSIVAEKRNAVSICANSEPSEESNNCTNYGPIPDEVDNVQLHTIENMSEYPVDLLA